MLACSAIFGTVNMHIKLITLYRIIHHHDTYRCIIYIPVESIFHLHINNIFIECIENFVNEILAPIVEKSVEFSYRKIIQNAIL